jgi:hypothetical protein
VKLTLCCVFVAAGGIAAAQDQPKTWWDWQEPGILDGWTANAEVETPDVQDGALTGVATGPDPYFIAPIQPFPADDVGSICVVMRTSHTGEGAVYWMTEGDADYTGEKMMDWHMEGGDEFQTIYVPVGAHDLWEATITGLRFDPVNSVPGAQFAVDWFELVPAAIRWTFDKDGWFEGWEPAHDIADATVAGGVLSGRSTGVDPYFLLPPHGLKAEEYAGIIVRMKLEDGEPGAVYFLKQGDTLIQPDSAVSLSITGTGQMTEMFAPLSGNPNWRGRIRQLRFDPTQDSPNARFSIDFLELVPRRDRWDFDHDGYFEGWYDRTDLTEEHVTGGAFVGSARADPYVYVPVVPFRAEEVRGVRFSAWGNRFGAWAVYWARDDSPAFDEAKMAYADLDGGGTAYREGFIDLSKSPEWRGTITRLRFDPLNAFWADELEGRPAAAAALQGPGPLLFAIDWLELVRPE